MGGWGRVYLQCLFCLRDMFETYVSGYVCLKHTLKKKGRAFRNIGTEKYISLTVKSALLLYYLSFWRQQMARNFLGVTICFLSHYIGNFLAGTVSRCFLFAATILSPFPLSFVSNASFKACRGKIYNNSPNKG